MVFYVMDVCVSVKAYNWVHLEDLKVIPKLKARGAAHNDGVRLGLTLFKIIPFFSSDFNGSTRQHVHSKHFQSHTCALGAMHLGK